MKLKTIHHIAIICSDREKALDFYHNKLGFSVIRDNYRIEQNDSKIDLKLGNMELELFIKKDQPKRLSYPEAYGLRHLSFLVDSVPETIKELESSGVYCEPIRYDTYTGKAMTFFQDPDGLPIEIHE